MEGSKWKFWGQAFLNYSKALGSQIADGAVYVGQKTKEGAIFVGQKTKEGALYVAEKSKPATDKIKEGALYVAEKTKPATDKIKEGAVFVGNKVQNAYVDVKCKITGESVPQQQPQQEPPKEEGNPEQNFTAPTTMAENVNSQPREGEVPTTIASTETLDNQQNQENPYPQI